MKNLLIRNILLLLLFFPEFLSVFEIERLIKELEKDKIDCNNIFIIQIVFVNKENDNCNCDMCKGR